MTRINPHFILDPHTGIGRRADFDELPFDACATRLATKHQRSIRTFRLTLQGDDNELAQRSARRYCVARGCG